MSPQMPEIIFFNGYEFDFKTEQGFYRTLLGFIEDPQAQEIAIQVLCGEIMANGETLKLEFALDEEGKVYWANQETITAKWQLAKRTPESLNRFSQYIRETLIALNYINNPQNVEVILSELDQQLEHIIKERTANSEVALTTFSIQKLIPHPGLPTERNSIKVYMSFSLDQGDHLSINAIKINDHSATDEKSLLYLAINKIVQQINAPEA